MLYTNLSVQSTLLEGFTANGSLGYLFLSRFHLLLYSNNSQDIDRLQATILITH